MKIKKSHLKELIRQSIKSIVSEAETVKFKDPETGKEHEITMDTAQRYKSDIEGGDTSKEKMAAVKAAGLDKDDKGDKEKSEPKKTKISADPFAKDKEDTDSDVGGSEEKPKRPEAMNDLDWDNEIEPNELEGWIQDNIKRIPPSLKNNVNKLVDRYEELYSEEDYDKAAVVQKRLDSLSFSLSSVPTK